MAAAIPYIVMAAAAAGSAAVADRRQRKIEKAQKETRRVEMAIQNEQSARARRQQVAKALVAQSQIANQAAAGGTQASSAAMVSTGGVAAQAGTNIGNINTALAQSNSLSAARQRELNAANPSFGEMFISNMAGSVASGAASGIGQAAGGKIANSLFGP